MMNETQEINILLVEDDDGHADLVSWNLEKVGIINPLYRVKNGQQALDFLQQEGQYSETDIPPASTFLVLLDINMPVMNGYEVIESVRANKCLKLLPIIMLTTAGDTLEVTKCYELGCNLFIKKPIDHPSLINMIQQLGTILTLLRLPSPRAMNNE